VISSGTATLHELDSVYSLKDAYNLLEIAEVNAHNRRVIDQAAQRRQEQQ
jgi:hypothetical protein